MSANSLRRTDRWNGTRRARNEQLRAVVRAGEDARRVLAQLHNPERPDDDLARIQELFEFLQGRVPDGYHVSDAPALTPEQAWTVIWYLGNTYERVPDYIERCDICGALYNSEGEGDVLDYDTPDSGGKEPYHFCGSCMEKDEWHHKACFDPDEESRPYDWREHRQECGAGTRENGEEGI